MVIRLWSDTWVPEYVAALVSIGSMAAIIAILGSYSGQILASWTFPDNVTINAVIAVLNTVSKAFMTFMLTSALGQWRWIYLRTKSESLKTFALIDSASQGPLGSMRLIWNTRCLTFMSIGAIFMILNLASDPFVQQIISFQPRTIFQDDPTVSLPRVSSYSRSNINEPTFSMTAAVSSGFGADGPNATAVFPINCPSSQCFYPTFRTLGFCSQCHDATSNLRQVANYSTRFSVGDGSYDIFTTAYTFNNVFLANGKNPYGDTLWLVMNVSLSVDSSNETYRAFSGPGTNLTFATFSLINMTDVSTVYNWPNSTLSASECALSLCVQQLQSNVTNGTLVENVTIVETESHDDGEHITLYDPNKPDELYTVRDSVITHLQLYFYNFLPGVAIDVLEVPESRYQPDFTTNYVTLTNNSAVFPNSEVEVIYKSTNLTETFANVATAMSHSMRQYADGSPSVLGQVGINQTVVIVRWAWITLPLGNVLLGLIFLVITVWQTHREQLPLWKSGQLALVLHGIASPKDGVARSRTPMTTSTMEDRARGILIAVQTSPVDGLRICTSKKAFDQSQKPDARQEKFGHPPLESPRKPVGRGDDGPKYPRALRSGRYTLVQN